MFTIDMLPADEGDALWIEYGANPVRRILIDCGRRSAYRAAAERLAADARGLELFVLTHVDADHIAGAVPLLQDARFGPSKVRDVWFNGWRHLNGLHWDPRTDTPETLGAQQGEYFAALLQDRGFQWNAAFDGLAVKVPDDGPLPRIELEGGMVLTLLGPTTEKLDALRGRWEKELAAVAPAKRIEPGDYERALEVLGSDRRQGPDLLGGGHGGPIVIPDLLEVPFTPDEGEPNGTSITFLAEYQGLSVLFGADAHAPQVEASLRRLLAARRIERLPLTAFKLSHHGSARNTSPDLLRLVTCPHYLVSTNGTRHHHPDPETLARVLDAAGKGDVTFHFNYETDETRPWLAPALQQQFGFRATGPDGDGGARVRIGDAG
ncbi:MAG: MBL fold metallo-hydrolase [Vicinamibacterales bacterium]